MNPALDYFIIIYNLPKDMGVTLMVHNISGQLIQTLVSENKVTGQHQVEWDVKYILSGLYFYTLTTGHHIITKECII